MSKQDRTYTRTPTDIEAKYNLGGIKSDNDKQTQLLSMLNQMFAQFEAETNTRLKEVEDKLSTYGYYPIGSIHISVDKVNPSTLFGGEWVLYTDGYLVVGTDVENTLFQSLGKCYIWQRTK